MALSSSRKMMRALRGSSLIAPARSVFHSPKHICSVNMSTLKEKYDNVIAETRGKVGLITLNRPKVNALCDALFEDLIHAAKALDTDPNIHAMVITGSIKAFAGGADIKEMSTKQFAEVYSANMFSQWAEIAKLTKPTIAAVNGFCLGGGCELAMMCDIIVAGENAKFGQPEIKLGVIPGAGGTQRLIRAVGKSKAMEMCLTGEFVDAHWAEKAGLVSKVVPKDQTVDEALAMADKIAQFSLPVTQMCKEAVKAAHEMTLEEGLRFERRLFHGAFALDDQKEGMRAFLSKETPNFKNK
mmetsp:Transcript_34638/g.44468  ORF Transcript_34638/g.44468 Transcript_34638/m.44468 type:complete len:298 (+) Transcript_34638:63-956(+)